MTLWASLKSLGCGDERLAFSFEFWRWWKLRKRAFKLIYPEFKEHTEIFETRHSTALSLSFSLPLNCQPIKCLFVSRLFTQTNQWRALDPFTVCVCACVCHNGVVPGLFFSLVHWVHRCYFTRCTACVCVSVWLRHGGRDCESGVYVLELHREQKPYCTCVCSYCLSSPALLWADLPDSLYNRLLWATNVCDIFFKKNQVQHFWIMLHTRELYGDLSIAGFPQCIQARYNQGSGLNPIFDFIDWIFSNNNRKIWRLS